MHISAEHVSRATEQRGWFFNQLVLIESVMWGRWSWWLACMLNGTIQDWKIPQVPFADHPGGGSTPAEGRIRQECGDDADRLIEQLGSGHAAVSHVRSLIERVTRHSSGHLRDIIDWWLWAFGSARIESRPVLDDRVAIALYSELRLELLIAHPCDWGTVLIQSAIGEHYGKGSAWFPTPMGVVQMMAAMSFGGDEDHRLKTFNEPCVGTGNFVLAASNYSLRLSCADVDYLMCSITEFMGYLFVPWLVKPGDGFIREFGETRIESRVRKMRELLTMIGEEPAAASVSQLELF